jgi:pimeloyl-ACP methyl ester carboxylesterase
LGTDRALAGRSDPSAVPVHRRIERSVITGLIGAKRVHELDRVLPNLKGKLIIDGAGHWVQQECANEVNAALIAFLNESRS